MKSLQWTIDAAHVGERLDQFVTAQTVDYSRSAIQEMIKKGHIRVNGNTVKTGYSLRENDHIDMDRLEPVSLDLEAVNLRLEIVYQDDDLAVINKPEGLVVHPASSYQDQTLVHGLLFQLDDLSSINGTIRPGIVHRLDKDTSGLMLVAKHDRAHQLLSEALKNHTVERTYVALVEGTFEEKGGTIDAPIGRDPKNRLKMTVIASGKPSKTHFSILETFFGCSLVECRLETGRTHQIRVHMAYIGHPVLGDPQYGPKRSSVKTGQYLHAKSLRFQHPIKKEWMAFNADLPV